MKKTLSNAKITGFGMIFLLLTVAFVLLYINLRQFTKQSVLISHTDSLIVEIQSVVSGIHESGANYRGYILFRENSYIDDFYTATIFTKNAVNTLRQLTANNDAHRERLDSLHTFVTTRFDAYETAIVFANIVNPIGEQKDSLLKVGYDSREMSHIMDGLQTIKKTELESLRKIVERVKRLTSLVSQINFIALLLATLLTIWFIATFRKESRAKAAAFHEAEAYRLELETKLKALAEANIKIKELKNEEKFASTGRMAHMIAHEIRNPLTNINLANDQLKETPKDNDEYNTLLNMITRNSNRINQLISDLLHATRLIDLKFQKVKALDVIEETIQQCADRINLNRIQLVKNYHTPHTMINADKQRLKIAFLNIIINAIEAVGNEEGKIVINTHENEDKTKMEIIFADNGPGMDEESQQKLFEPFFTSKMKGNGLGLTNTQNIILNHKGSIRVDSELGKGTNFIVSLPIVTS